MSAGRDRPTSRVGRPRGDTSLQHQTACCHAELAALVAASSSPHAWTLQMESLDPIEIGYLRDLSIDLLTMVVVVRQRVIHFGGGELREFAQDLLDGQAA